jgi:hypothetical protein
VQSATLLVAALLLLGGSIAQLAVDPFPWAWGAWGAQTRSASAISPICREIALAHRAAQALWRAPCLSTRPWKNFGELIVG